MLDRGYWRAGTIGGAELRVHWSVPIGAVLFGRLALAPAAWIAFAIVLVVHALGHVAMTRACSARVVALYVTGLGVDCAWRGVATRGRESAIAWGGIAGQAVLFVIALAASAVFDAPPFVAQLLAACVAPNAALALANLLPIAGFDGVEAWRFLRREPDIDHEQTVDETLDDPEVDEVVDRLFRDAARRNEKE